MKYKALVYISILVNVLLIISGQKDVLLIASGIGMNKKSILYEKFALG